jgi:hypothetical protein
MDTSKILEILKIVTENLVLEVNREIQIEPIKFMKFYNNLESLLKQEIPYWEIGKKLVLLLVLTTEEEENSTALNIFEPQVFVSNIKDGLLDKGNILLVNYDGKIVKQVEGKFVENSVEAARYSAENHNIAFLIQYMTVHLFVDGRLLDYIHNIMQSSRTGVTTPKILPAREYRQLVENQYYDMVYKQRVVQYWADKANRILIDRPEIHFHKPLWWYLKENIIDGHVDSGATISGTEDRTDIRIITFENGEIYIIEIKCLGKTKKSVIELSDDWANAGLVQLNEYLKDEAGSTAGTLVLYDGRTEDKQIVWCTTIECSPKYDNKPVKFYLESESASAKAKRIVRDLKKKSRE